MQDIPVIPLTPWPEYNFFFTLMVAPFLFQIPIMAIILMIGRAQE